LSRLRNGVLSYQQILADCNPGDPQHWLKQRCDSGQTKLLESRHEDNPTLWDAHSADWTDFGRGYMQTLDALSGFQHQRLRLGQWVAAEGQYFTEFDPRVHVVDAFDIPSDWPRWIAVDYGFAAPFCALWFARDPNTRRIVTYREIYAAGLRDEQQADLIFQRSEGETIQQLVLDPSMLNARTEQQRPSIASVYAQRGLAAIVRQGIYPGMNSRKQGWAIMRRALAPAEGIPPRWTIMRERCPNLLRELPALVHDRLDPEDAADKIGSTAVSDHACDAARYGLCAEAIAPQETQPRNLIFGGR
jgi:phage terminase large subunit